MKIAKSRILPFLFLIDAPLIIALVLFLGFGFSGYFGQDSHEFLRFTTAWKESGFDPESIADFQSPVGYPLAGILFSYFGLSLKWALVLVSFLAAWATLLLLNRMIREMYGRDGTLWLMLGAVTQVYFIRGGFLALSDMLCTFFVLATAYFLWEYAQRKKWTSLLFACALSAAAFSVNYLVIPLLIVPFIAAFIRVFREERMHIRVAASVFLIALCSSFLYADARFLSALGEFIGQWDLRHFIALSSDAESTWQERTVPNILYAFGNFMHLGYLSAGVFLLPYYRRLTWKHPLFLGVALYLLFLMGLEAQNYRYLMIVHPLILLLLFPAFDALKSELQKRRIWRLFLSGILLINFSFFVYSFRKTYAVFEAEKVISEELKAMNSNDVIYSFYVDQSFPTYGVKNEVRNLYLSEYDHFEVGALVVADPVAFEQEWKETVVGKNWRRLNAENELELIKEVYGNWKIYRIR